MYGYQLDYVGLTLGPMREAPHLERSGHDCRCRVETTATGLILALISPVLFVTTDPQSRIVGYRPGRGAVKLIVLLGFALDIVAKPLGCRSVTRAMLA